MVKLSAEWSQSLVLPHQHTPIHSSGGVEPLAARSVRAGKEPRCRRAPRDHGRERNAPGSGPTCVPGSTGGGRFRKLAQPGCEFRCCRLRDTPASRSDGALVAGYRPHADAHDAVSGNASRGVSWKRFEGPVNSPSVELQTTPKLIRLRTGAPDLSWSNPSLIWSSLM